MQGREVGIRLVLVAAPEPGGDAMSAPLEPALRLRLHRWMLANRLVEERLTGLYRQGKITGGFFRSLEFTSINALAYSDVPRDRMSRATSFASALPRWLTVAFVS